MDVIVEHHKKRMVVFYVLTNCQLTKTASKMTIHLKFYFGFTHHVIQEKVDSLSVNEKLN